MANQWVMICTRKSLIVLSLLFGHGAWAGNYIWTGSTDTDWGVSTNWSPNGIPGASDTVNIDGSSTKFPILDTDRTIYALYIEADTTGGTVVQGELDLGGYDLTVTYRIYLENALVENGALAGASEEAHSRNSTVNCKIDVESSSTDLHNNVFKGRASFEIDNDEDAIGGGNLFEDSTFIKCSATEEFYVWGVNLPDSFLGPLSVINESPLGIILSASASDNYFGDKVTVHNEGGPGSVILFGYQGTSLFADTVIITATSGSDVVFNDQGSCIMDSSATVVIGESGFLGDTLLFQDFTKYGDIPIALTRVDSATAVSFIDCDIDGDVISLDSAIVDILNSTFRKALRVMRADNFEFNEVYGVTELVFYPTTIWSGEKAEGNLFRDSLYVTNGSHTKSVQFGHGTTPDTCYGPVVLKTFNNDLMMGSGVPGNYFASDVHIINRSTSASDIIMISNSASASTFIGGNVYVTSDGGAVYLGNYGSLDIGAGSTLIVTDEGMDGNTGLFAKNLEFQGAGPPIVLDSVTRDVDIQFYSSIVRRAITTAAEAGKFRALYSEFYNPLSIISGRIYSVNSTYHEDVSFEKTWSVNDYNGGNRFEKEFSMLLNTAEGHSYWSISEPDTFMGDVTLRNITTGTRTLRIGYNRPAVLHGDVLAYPDSYIVVLSDQYEVGGLHFVGDGYQTLYNENTNNYRVSRIRVDKPTGKLKLGGYVMLTDTLWLTKGVVEVDANTTFIIHNDDIVYGGSDSSHVEGTIRKYGDDAFTFPLGDGGVYRPISMSAPASTSDAFTAEYRDKNSNGRHRHKYRDTTIHSIDAEGYWVFNRNNGSSVPEVTLGWDSLTCGVKDTSGLRIVGWGATDTAWVDLGKKNLTGDTLSGVLTNSVAVLFGELALGSDTLNELYCPYDPYEECPLPNFTFTSGCIGDTLQFTDASTGDMTGAVYSWNFDDSFSSSDNHSSLTDPEHAFISGGPFYVSLNIQGLNGCDLTYMDTVSMSRQLPDSSYFSSDIKTAKANEPFKFFYTGDALSGQSFSWDMGDGTTYASSSYSLFDTISYSYDTAGVYFVKFYHWTDVNCKGVQTVKAKVSMVADDCIIADFGASVSCVGEPTVFSDRSVGQTEGADYHWLYQSGVTGNVVFSTQPNPSFVFSDEGPYEITLAVIKDSACADIVTKQIHFINELRDTTEVEFGARFVEINDDIVFHLDGAITDAIYELDFDDGTSTLPSDSFPRYNFTHDYPLAGIYDVKLTHGDSGCLSVRRYQVFVDDPSGSCPTIEAGTDIVSEYEENHTLGGSPTISGGTSPFSSAWFPSYALDDSTLTNPDVVARLPQEYILKVEDNNSCVNFDSVRVDMLADLLVSTVGFDTILDTYEKIRYSLRSNVWKETVVSGSEKNFTVGLPTSGSKEVRLLFFTDPTEIMAKVSLELNSAGNISNVKLIETDAISGEETKISLGDTYFTLENGPGSITFESPFADRYLNKEKYTDSEALYYCAGENSRNYQEIRLYGDNGSLTSKARVYTDYLGRTSQSQARVFAGNTTLAAQNVTDAFGRSAISSLTAPTDQNFFCYKDDFMEAADGVPYTHEHFDIPNLTSHQTVVVSGEDDNPQRVFQGLEGSLGHYYSNANQDEPFVAASKFPYSRIEYYNDPLSRVKRIASAGEHHRMGKGYETKVFQMVSGGEYGSYIGTEVSKTVTVDADGLTQITFTDNYGRVKASCVSGVETDCPAHVVSKTMRYNGTRSVDIHLPKAYIEELLLPLNQGYGIYNNDVVYTLQNLETGKVLTADDWSLDGSIVIIDNQALLQKDLFLRISYEYSSDYLTWLEEGNQYSWPSVLQHLPNQQVIYRLDYSNWTLNEYFGVSDHLKRSVQPEGLDCDQTTTLPTTIEFGTEFKYYTGQLYEEIPDEYQQNPVAPAFNTEQAWGLEPDELALYTDIDGDPDDLYDDAEFQDHSLEITIDAVGSRFLDDCSGLTTPDVSVLLRIDEPQIQLKNFITPEQHYRLSEEGEIEHSTAYELHNFPEDPCSGHCSNGIYDPECGETEPDVGEDCGNPWNPSTCGDIPPVITAEYRFGFEVMGKEGSTYTYLGEDVAINTSNTSTTPIEHYLYLTLKRDCECNQRFYKSYGLPSSLTLTVQDVIIDDHTDGYYVNLKSLAVKTPYDTDWQTAETADHFEMFQETYYTVSALHSVYPRLSEPEPISGDYATSFEYNQLDQLISMDDVDRGSTEMLYNVDGQVRFFQNEEQAIGNKAFTYVTYDAAGRPIEIGEYDSDAHHTADANKALRFQNEAGLPSILGSEKTVLDILDGWAALSSWPDNYGKSQRYVRYDLPDESSSSHYPFPLSGGLSQQKNCLGRVSKTWNAENITWYSYLYDGRLDWTVKYNDDLDELHITEYEYDDVGNVEEVVYKHGTSQGDEFHHFFSYDQDQRLKTVRTGTDEFVANSIEQAEYKYYAHGPLKRVETASDLQGTDYFYTINGWLKGINSPNLGYNGTQRFTDPGKDGIATSTFGQDLFGMTIDYFSSDYRRFGTNINYGDAGTDESHSGLIKSIRWNTDNVDIDLSGSGTHNMYSYEYDWHKWLTSATFGEYAPTNGQNGNSYTSVFAGALVYSDGVGQSSGIPNQVLPDPNFTADAGNDYLVSNITYDRNGNLLTLDRNAYDSYLSMDEFTYNYTSGTNKLDYVQDAGTDSPGSFKDIKGTQASGNYSYNSIGQLIGDADNSEKNFVEYDVYGMATNVYWETGHTNLKAKYLYDERGQRIKKKNFDETGDPLSETYYLRDVFGSLMETRLIEDGSTSIDAQDYTIMGLGRIGFHSKTDDEYRYEITDHLGNLRVSYKEDVNGDPEVLSASDYYPFGMRMPGRGEISSSTAASHGYQGVFAEEDRHLNWSTFDLRTYDGRLGRFHSEDPYAEFHSPFMAMGNNPLSFVDPTGGSTGGGGPDPKPKPFHTTGHGGHGGLWASSEVYNSIAEMPTSTGNYTPGAGGRWSDQFLDQNLTAPGSFGTIRPSSRADAIREHQATQARELVDGQANTRNSGGSNPAINQFGSGLFDGAVGLTERVIGLVTHPVESVKEIGQGIADQATLVSPSTEGFLARMQLGKDVVSAISEIPNMTKEQLFYAGGLATWAVFEAVIFKKAKVKLGMGLRAAYVKEVKGLSSIASKMRAGGSSSEQIARTLHGKRRALGVKYKSLTPDNVLQQIYNRNLQKYGDKLGPSIDYLRQQGKSWDDIIKSATRPGGKDLGF